MQTWGEGRGVFTSGEKKSLKKRKEKKVPEAMAIIFEIIFTDFIHFCEYKQGR